MIKQRLLEMIPGVRIFLDVDDLEEIGDLEGYIARSHTVLIYLSAGYTASKNVRARIRPVVSAAYCKRESRADLALNSLWPQCMRELVSAVEAQKPMVAIVDPEADRGGLTMDEVRAQLLETAESSFPRWGFDETTPDGEALFDALTASTASAPASKGSPYCEEIEWNRIGVFQEVSLRLIAERLLVTQRRRRSDASSSVQPCRTSASSPRRMLGAFIDRRLSLQSSASTDGASPRRKSALSPHCKSGAAVSSLQESSQNSSLSIDHANAALTYTQSDVTRKTYALPSPRKGRRFHLYCSREVHGSIELAQEVQGYHGLNLQVTQELSDLRSCERMLVYLHKETWRTGPASDAFAQEVAAALRCGVQLLLAHEMLGTDAEARGGVDFGSFFDCEQGTTPPQLVRAGIYSQIAVALKGGAHRQVSMSLLTKALIDAPEDVRPVTVASSLKLDALASNAAVGPHDAPTAMPMVLRDASGDGLEAKASRTTGLLQRWQRWVRPAYPMILSSVDSRSDDCGPRRASVGQSTTV